MRIICLDGTEYSGPRTQLQRGGVPLAGDILIWTISANGNDLYTATGRQIVDNCFVRSWLHPNKNNLSGTISENVKLLSEFERRNLCP